jgi:hypothetical protein
LTGKVWQSDSIGAHGNKEGSLIDFKSVSTVDWWIDERRKCDGISGKSKEFLS